MRDCGLGAFAAAAGGDAAEQGVGVGVLGAVLNLRLITRQPPWGSGIRMQATSDALAISSPADRSTTVSIATD